MIGLGIGLRLGLDDGYALSQAITRAYSGSLYLPNDANCFQDSAGTTAGAKDAVVGKLLDVVGTNHLTQATAGYKPILRKGAVNLLKSSEAYDPTCWNEFSSGTAAISTNPESGAPDGITSSVKFAPNDDGLMYFGPYLPETAGVTYTATYYVRIDSGTLAARLRITNAPVTLTSAWQKFTETFTATSTTTRQYGVYRESTAVPIYIVAQIEQGAAASPYVKTTSAPASNGIGPWWLDFDGVDDELSSPVLSLGRGTLIIATEQADGAAISEANLDGTHYLRRSPYYGYAFLVGTPSDSEVATVARYLESVATGVDHEAASVNNIGAPGERGFGVGICPSVPDGFTALPFADSYGSTYGNYEYSDGSVMVWIPAFYYRIGHADNPTYAGYTGNSVDIKPYSYFADVAAANAAGYALHRAFYDGGSVQPGFFVDKYQASNNGGIASSLKNGNPLSSNAAHNPFSGLAGAPANNYGGAFAAAKTRGASFFPQMRYQFAALALLSLAHGQAATSRTWCAWYDGALATNYPKGCNNNALADANDATVKYVSDGYSNAAKTGGATLFAKTTHNGQNCGVADLNGNMWEITPGITCVSGTKAITGATQANPVALTVVGHGRTNGEIVMITGVGGMTQINDKLFTVTVVDADHITLDGTDGTAFSAYTSGGTLTYGTFYALNTSYSAKDLTGGNTLATDQFGAAGVAAHSSAVAIPFRTDYSQNGFEKRYGRGSAQVLGQAVSGDEWVLPGLGVPLASGISDGTSGSNLFGADYFYQYIRNELCLISGANWNYGSNAGVWAAHWGGARANSGNNVGFRAASYL